MNHINRRPFLGAGFLGSVCFDAIENQTDTSAPIRIWVEDGLGNVLWESTMGLDEEYQNSFYFYEAPGTIDYLNEHPHIAEEYEALKLELWKRYEHNRDAYTNAKTEFIRKWTAEARMKYVDRYL